VPGDHDVVGVSFGDARGDRPHAQLRDQLHAHGGARIDALQVVNQLRQIFNAIDVVMGRRADQRDSGLCMPQTRDQLSHFVAGKLAAFSGLGALRNLDLQFLGVRQVLGGNAEAARSHLLDLVVARQKIGRSVRLGAVRIGIFAAFAGIGAAAQLVHGKGDGFVRLGTERAKRHATGDETSRQAVLLLHLIHRQLRTGGAEVQQVAQHRGLAFTPRSRESGPCFSVGRRGGRGLCGCLRGAHSHLKLARPLRFPGVPFGSFIATETHPAVIRQFGVTQLACPRGANGSFDLWESASSQRRWSSGEAAFDHCRVESENVKQLRRSITVEHGDSHLRHHLGQARLQGLEHPGFTIFPGQCARGLQSQPGTNRAGAISNEHGGVMQVATVASLQSQTDFSAQASFDQRVMYRAGGHRHRNWQGLRRSRPVGHQQDANSFPHQLNSKVA
jgi:hypothetical protein